MPRAIYRKYKQDDRSISYLPMENEGLLEIAQELYADDDARPILARVGVHGDLTESEEEQIDAFVIDRVESREWKSPHPANLIIPIALARLFTDGELDPADPGKALEFVADRRCDGVVPENPSTYKPCRLSELRPIMTSLSERDDIMAPFEKIRHRTLRPGEAFFESNEQGELYNAAAMHYVFQQRFKYALLNRDPFVFKEIVSLLGLFAERLIDRIDDEKAVAHILNLNRPNSEAVHVVDDRKDQK